MKTKKIVLKKWKWTLLFLPLAVISVGLSLILNPPHQYLTVTMDRKVMKSISWDSGYGYNQYQYKDLSTESPNQSKFELLKFDRLVKIQTIKFEYLDGTIKEFKSPFDNQSQIRLTKGRHWKSWFLFLVGILTVSFAATILIAAARAEPKIFTVGLVGLIAFYWASFPGLSNSTNPLISLFRAQKYEFTPDYSILLQGLWAALYEVYPSVHTIQLTQMALYASFVILLTHKLQILTTHRWFILAITLILLFNPMSLSSYIFLERSYFAGAVTFFTFAFSYLQLRQKARLSITWQIVFLLMFASLTNLRSDNLPMALLVGSLFFVVTSKKPVVFISLLLGLTFALSKWSDHFQENPGWRNYYFISSAEEPIRQILLEKGFSALKPGQKERIESIYKLENLGTQQDNKCAISFAALRSHVKPEQAAYLPFDYLDIVSRHPNIFLVSRAECFWWLLSQGNLAWNTKPEQPIHYRIGLDLNFLPRNYESIGTTPSILKYIHSASYWPWLRLYPAFFIILICLFTYKIDRYAALISAALMIRFIIAFFLSPAPSGFYFYDAYLLAIFFIFIRWRDRVSA